MLLLHVPVPDEEVYLGILLLETPGQFFGDGYGAVPAAGAADAEGEVGLAFRSVAGDEEGEEIVRLLQEFLAVFGAKHRFAHGRVVAGEGSEIRVVVRVWQETDIEEGVHVEGGAVFEAEGDEADGHPVGKGLRKLLETQAGVERGVVRGVDYEVGHRPDVAQVPPLAAYGFQDVSVAGCRMGPAALLVAPEERGIVRVDEQDAVLPALRPLHGLQVPLELLPEVAPPPDVHDHDQPVGASIPLSRRLHDRRDHARRQIVYTKIPRVLESLKRIALARPGKPGNDHDPAPARSPRTGSPLTHAASSDPHGMHKPSRKSRLAPRVTARNRHQTTGIRYQVCYRAIRRRAGQGCDCTRDGGGRWATSRRVLIPEA